MLQQGDPEIVRAIFNKYGTIDDPSYIIVQDFYLKIYMGDLSLEKRESFVAFLHTLM